MALIVRVLLPIVAVVMIVLGVISIIMGLAMVSPKYPDAQVCGAVFFAGGWILLGIEQLAWHLRANPKS